MNDPAGTDGQRPPEIPRRISPSELMEISLEGLADLDESREQLLKLSDMRSGTRPRHLHEVVRSTVGGR